jgi:hypothetical protein
MYTGSATELASVLNPANYILERPNGERAVVHSVRYDVATRRAYLSFESLVADEYELRVASSIKSTQGLGLGQTYTASFTTLLNCTESVQITFAGSRSDRLNGTVSYDVSNEYRQHGPACAAAARSGSRAVSLACRKARSPDFRWSVADRSVQR